MGSVLQLSGTFPPIPLTEKGPVNRACRDGGLRPPGAGLNGRSVSVFHAEEVHQQVIQLFAQYGVGKMARRNGVIVIHHLLAACR